MSYAQLHDVDMSEFALNTEGGQGLCTLALVTSVGIAVTVAYSSESRTGEPRPDKFLAHIDEATATRRLRSSRSMLWRRSGAG